MTLNEKLNLIADLEAENLTEAMIENVIHMEEHPEDWKGPFNTPEEALAYLERDDEEETSDEDN